MTQSVQVTPAENQKDRDSNFSSPDRQREENTDCTSALSESPYVQYGLQINI